LNARHSFLRLNQIEKVQGSMKIFLVFMISLLGMLVAAPIESQAKSFTNSFVEGPRLYPTDHNEYRYYKGTYYNPGNDYYYYHRRVYYPRSYHSGYYFGPDHQYRWF